MAWNYRNTPSNMDYFSLYKSFNELKGAAHWLVKLVRSRNPEIIDNIEDKVVMDLGCGWGSEFIRHLKEREKQPKKYVHMDADKQVFSRRSYHDELPQDIAYDWSNDLRICADAHSIPIRDESVDIVHMYGLFKDQESALDREKIFEEIRRILKPGGFFIDGDNYPYRSINIPAVQVEGCEIFAESGGQYLVHRKTV